MTSLIKAMATAIPPEEVEKGIAVLKNRTLAQQVEREILHVKKVPVFFLNVKCEGGTVTLNGIAHSADVMEQARQAAFIDGVKTVVSKLEIGLHGHYEGRI